MQLITPLPAPPSRSDPENFVGRADAFMGALPLFATQLDAVAQLADAAAVTAVSAPGTLATSATTLAPATGLANLAVQPGKMFVVGMFALIVSRSSPTNYMVGQITAYNIDTGALSVLVTFAVGSGAYNDWNVALTLAVDLSRLVRQEGGTFARSTFSNGQFRVGSQLTGNRTVFVDLLGDDVNVGYGARFIRNAGQDGDTVLGHRGAGNLMLQVLDGGAMVVRTYTADRLVVENGGTVRPGADGTQDLGNPLLRWNNVRAAVGTIQTSDGREKEWRGAFTADELSAARDIGRSIGVYQWKSAIATKGRDGARWHIGVEAQQVVSIMLDHGLDPMRYGFVCHDSWETVPERPARPEVRDEDDNLIQVAQAAQPAIPAGDRYGIRYDELSMFVLAAQEIRLSALEDA